jgi:hypothetical protein
MKNLPRVWVSIDKWEEIKHNMWGEVDNRADMLSKAVDFTGNAALYGQFMRRVTNEWPNSCANSLTDYQMNRKAWVGHAACALALGCPEDITRQAWGLLTDEQRLLANAEADRAIHSWEVRQRKGKGVHNNMEQEVLF